MINYILDINYCNFRAIFVPINFDNRAVGPRLILSKQIDGASLELQNRLFISIFLRRTVQIQVWISRSISYNKVYWLLVEVITVRSTKVIG